MTHWKKINTEMLTFIFINLPCNWGLEFACSLRACMGFLQVYRLGQAAILNCV